MPSRKQNKESKATQKRYQSDAPLVVWGERRPEPDWDRFLAALIALALRRVEEDTTKEARD